MARGSQTVTTTTRGRRKKTGGDSGYVQCQRCHGSGRVKKGGNARSSGGGRH